MDLLTPLPGAAAVLAAHARSLPQPDQLCGPFAAHVGLHAVLVEPPSVVALAVAAGTTIWPEDVTEWRPPGTALDTTGWSSLGEAASRDACGTDATGLAHAVAALPGVEVVPAAGGPGLPALLAGLLGLGTPVGVLANVGTGPMGLDWEVGHFVVVHAYDPDDELVGVADTYPELGAPRQPVGCRVVTAATLNAGLCEPPGRGLLLLVRPADAGVVRALVEGAGLTRELWSV